MGFANDSLSCYNRANNIVVPVLVGIHPIRTAHAAGAGAVVIPERRAAGLTETVAKAAAGALAHLPVIRVVNVSHSIEDFKKRGYWIYGLDERGDHVYNEIQYSRPTVIVV